jgi:hypothetical protein
MWHDFVNSGAFNYALSAEYHNAENIVTLKDPAIAAWHFVNWNYHRTHSGARIPAALGPPCRRRYHPA